MGVPHFLQKLAPGFRGELQFLQNCANAFPHFSQNSASASFSKPHLLQFIGLVPMKHDRPVDYLDYINFLYYTVSTYSKTTLGGRFQFISRGTDSDNFKVTMRFARSGV